MGEMGNIFQNKKTPYAWIRTALAVEPIPYKKSAGLLPEQ
jgi:hypothetical protein